MSILKYNKQREEKLMEFITNWHFTCKQDKSSGGYVLENSRGVLAGRVVQDSNEQGTRLVVTNSRNQIALVLEITNGRNHHAVVLVPRSVVADTNKGLAIFGIVHRKTNDYDTVYEYESSAGSDVMQVAAVGFPRRLLISKVNIRVAEIDKKPGEITVHLVSQAKDTDVLVIIGITLAVCLLLPIQSNMPQDMKQSAILIG
jgi:hypothetical protein